MPSRYQELKRTPQYVKQINERLYISLSYLNTSSLERGQHSSDTECIIGLHNVSDESIVVNPSEEEKSEAKAPANGWFGSFFGSGEATADTTGLINDKSAESDIHVFLGYVQLFGYVVLNYNFVLADGGPIDSGTQNPHWWENKDYVNQYQLEGEEPDEGEDDDDTKELKMNNVPFISENRNKPLVVGGKLGGVNDLRVDNSALLINSQKKYILRDLLYTFNSHKPPKSFKFSADQDAEDIKLPLSELTDSILPFYSTSQSLLFSDVSIPPSSAKTFHIKFPQNLDLPPSYNARSTGPVRDQGWVSIKYSLIVGLSQGDGTNKLTPHAVYFPLNVKGERLGSASDRWLQKDYLQDGPIIDKSWSLDFIEEETSDSVQNIAPNPPEESEDTRAAFLDDLAKLINSDLYNMPKVSSTERRKSTQNMSTIEDGSTTDSLLVPQLPQHLKTQYQLRVNNVQLCLISLSRPYYHIGDDVNFILDINPLEHSKFTKISGFVAFVEAHEVFHAQTEGPEPIKKDFSNIYACTPRIKYNTLASNLSTLKAATAKHSSSLVNASIHIPRHLSQQFQCSKFLSLKYYLVFKFNLLELLEEDIEADETTATEENSEPLLEATHSDLYSWEHLKSYQFENTGTELKFRLPLVLLP